MAEPYDVVAIGAHPDDVEIGCGGTLARLASRGARVAIIDLTDGEPTPKSPGPDVRMAEAAEAATVLGVERRVLVGLGNRRLFDSVQARVDVARHLRQLRPRLVFGLRDKTPMASPDHWQAVQIVDGAIEYAAANGIDARLDEFPAHRIEGYLTYHLGADRFGVADPRDLVVDIGKWLDTKLAAVRCYATQFPPEKAYVFERLRMFHQGLGIAAGCAAAEGFGTVNGTTTENLFHRVLRGSDRRGSA